MPRGVKGSGKVKPVKSVDERIAENEELIASLQIKLSDAKAKRKELQQIKNKSEYDEIQKIIVKSKLSPEELKSLIEKK